MDINYDEATMNLFFDVYDLPVNTSLVYEILLEHYDGTSAKFNQVAEFESNSGQWSIYIDVGVELDPTNYSYGMYWASLDIWTDTGDHVIGDGTDICYGGPVDCDDVDPSIDFVCDNGNEIPMDRFDDGEDDCGDGSDEPNGTGDGGDDIEIASLDIDIWFEQWTNSKMEFVLVQSMVIDDAESIAMYTMMADSFFGNDDGEVTQDEVNLLLMMMSEESLEDFDMTDEMQLDGATGMLVDAWMDVKGLVEGDSEITMVMGQVVSFQTTPYADSTTHTFTFTESADADGDGLADGVDNDCDGCNDADGDGFDHTCEVDGIWIHNSDTWSVSSITGTTVDDDGGTPTLNFEYDGYNDAWFSADCPDKGEEITFILEKTDIGELPDPNDTNNPIIDWEEMDTNKLPMCAYAYAVVMADGTFDTRAGIDTAPESGDYIIDLMDGAEYKIYVVCIDPEGKEMTVTISNADLNLTSTYTATAEAEASLLLSVPTGYDGTYSFDVTWTDGHHAESGTLTVNGMGDGTGEDLEADGDGFLPGFTAALGIVALLGAAMISSRRN
jgi:PGF-CTERM protein